MSATYKKLQSGAWGIRATQPVKPGDRVMVEKRDGTSNEETVEKVVWTDRVGVWICAIVPSAAPARGKPRGEWSGSGWSAIPT
jgi:hypothetical protein